MTGYRVLAEEEAAGVKAAIAWKLLICSDLWYLQQDHHRRTVSETRMKLIVTNMLIPLWLGTLFWSLQPSRLQQHHLPLPGCAQISQSWSKEETQVTRELLSAGSQIPSATPWTDLSEIHHWPNSSKPLSSLRGNKNREPCVHCNTVEHFRCPLVWTADLPLGHAERETS